MLKIKPEVDLKELEKFGYEPRYSEITGRCIRYVKEDNRNIIRYIDNHHNYDPYWEVQVNNSDTLYDLIQAGLVEKE